VYGVVPGIDAATFTSLAEAAKDNCPVSSMMRGNVALSVEATLEG
jgi:organic hydroperoxide reductase OsmC/OhrA